MWARAGALLVLLAGCDIPIELPTPAGCDKRLAWYLDEDGDGIGDGTAVFIGCEAPGPDWVAFGPMPAHSGDTASAVDTDTGDPDDVVDTGDTAVEDTPHDTAVDDTAVDTHDTAVDTNDTAVDTSDTAVDTRHDTATTSG